MTGLWLRRGIGDVSLWMNGDSELLYGGMLCFVDLYE